MAITNNSIAYSFLNKGGETGELIRSIDWYDSLLGPVSNWPQSLRTTLSIILNSRFPMFLFWGPEHICFYNDAYRPSLGNSGKHPSAMGQRGEIVWPEIWPVIKPLIDAVLANGDATWSEDQLIPIYRNGRLEDVYWTFSYSPVNDESDKPAGVFVTCTETTEKVQTLQTLNESKRRLERSEAQLRSVFVQAPVAIGIFSGEKYVVDLVNPLLCELYGKTEAELLGKPVFSVLTDAAGKGFEQLLDEVRLTGKPFIGREIPVPLQKNGEATTAIVNFVYEPLRSAAGNITGVVAVATDVTDQFESRQKLVESEAQFRLMAESMPQQVWTADADGALDYVNTVTQQYFGRTAGFITGSGWQHFIHPDDIDQCIGLWSRAIATSELYQVEFRLQRNDGAYHWHLSRALPLKNNEKIIKWLGTNTDIEDHKQVEQKKDEFISIASHELKTPLTSLKAYLQLIDRIPGANTTTKQFVDKSLQQLKRLEKLVDDLLDVSKITSGKIIYNITTFNFAEAIREAVQSVQLAVATHRLIITENVNVDFEGDRFRIEQVITNFLTNAVKYSPGSDKVIIRSAIEQNNIIVAVQDFGIGIEKEHLGKLFDRFYRVDNTAMKYEGLGLGLYVASEILNRHKGNFWIESEPGAGSTFFFRLPLPQQSCLVAFEDTATTYISDAVSITSNKADAIMEVDWKGFHNLESVQHGCMKMLRILQENKYHKVLNNNIHVLGSWGDAAEWGGREWFPMMQGAGLQYFAWIYSPATFSKLAAEKSVDLMMGAVTTRFFTTVEEARQWLKEVVQVVE